MNTEELSKMAKDANADMVWKAGEVDIPRTNWNLNEFINALSLPPKEFIEWWNGDRKPSEVFGKMKKNEIK